MHDLHVRLVLHTNNSQNYLILFIDSILVHIEGHSYSEKQKNQKKEK